ncbi:hypothetical protein BH11PSE11_BH11PSE11_28050 [soil metagenome]
MRITKRVMSFLAAGLLAAPVLAQEGLATGSANVLSVPPKMAVLEELPQLTQADDKTSAQRGGAYEYGGEGAVARTDGKRQPIDSPSGLHWANDGQRPVLQYPLDSGAVMRIRGAGGGAAMSLNWNF